MIQQEIILNPWSKQPHVVLAVQGESQARTIITTLIDASGAPLNLTGKTARMYIDKADRTTVFFDGVTQNALNGVVAFTLPLQATTAAGNTNNCQIIVNDAAGATLVSYGLKIDVVPSKFNGVLESTSEFTALQDALATVQDIDNRVPKSTTIAGINLQNNITLNQLVAAGVASSAMLTQVNLLLNWYFANPVNQRGVSGTISTSGYFIDCWRLVSGTVTLTANGLTLNGTIAQTMEFDVGADVTASVSMHSGTATAAYNASTKIFTITSSGGTVKAAKLEKGTKSTIANDAPPNFAEQLALCQRYQFNNSSWFRVRVTQIHVNNVDFFVPLPVSMRINPTVRNDWAIKNLTGGIQTGFTFGWAWITNNGIQLRFIKTAHGLTDAFVEFPASEAPLFDANL